MTVYTSPVWELISRSVAQFEESPTAAQVSPLACGLKTQQKKPPARFKNRLAQFLQFPLLRSCYYVADEGDAELKEDTEVGAVGVAAQEAVSVQQGRQDASCLRQRYHPRQS